MPAGMKDVLFIAHHFPPMGGPGTNRSVQFVRHLPTYGYRPVVLTVSLDDVAASRYAQDTSLLEQLADVEIIRTRTGEPRRLRRFCTRLRIFRLLWFFLYPLFWEKDALWPLAAYPTARRVIRDRNIQLVYTTSGPYAALLLGYLLKKTMGVRWIADVRDPYSDGFWWQWPSKLHWIISRRVERFLFHAADKVVVNTPEVERLYRTTSFVPAETLTCITNGY